MAEEPTVLTPDGIESPGDENNQETSKSLIVSKDLLPEQVMVIPLHDRPMFPKMMGMKITRKPPSLSLFQRICFLSR